MADFVPPTGPPPPKVPEGYKAVWNDQYSEWFYVNIYTKKSQWDKPTEPIYGPPSDHSAPSGAPPGYDPARAQATGAEKLGSNNPYTQHDNLTEDERLARQLQAEEDARANRGASDSYYGPGSGPAPGAGYGGQPSGGYGGAPMGGQPSYDQQQLPPRPEQSGGRGLLGKLMGKGKNRPVSPQPGHGGGYGQQGYGGYGQQQQMYQQPGRRPGGGLGAGGGAALGLGGGLLGGMMLGNAMDGGGGGGGDDGGGDYGGGDGGGGDFGGGDGGGGGGD